MKPSDTKADSPPAARYKNQEALNPSPDSSWGKLLALIPDGSRVLDVGCSHGTFSSAMGRRKNCRVFGVEIDPAAARAAAERCDKVLTGDIAELLKSRRIPRDFDVIVVADVLEHLTDPYAVVRGLAAHLKPGGALLASVPNVTHLSVLAELAEGRFPRSSEGLLDSTHLQFFGESDLLSFFGKAGLVARVVDRVRMDPRLTEFKTDLEKIPDAVLSFLDRHPNSDTYQFIIRAVPKDWASDGDQAVPEGTDSAHPVTNALHRQLLEAQTRLAEHHRVLKGVEAESVELHRRLGEYHNLVSSKDEEYRKVSALLDEHARSIRELQALVAEKDENRRVLGEESAELYRRLKEYHDLVSSKDEEYRKASALLDEHARSIRELQALVAEKDESCRVLGEENVDLHRRIGEYHDLVSSKNEEYRTVSASLESEIARRERDMEHHEESRAFARDRRSSMRARFSKDLDAAALARLSVLYLADREDPPFRYRCLNACEQLRESGVAANILPLDAEHLWDELPRYSVVVFFRLRWSERVAEAIRRAKEAGSRVAFDIDDLIFDPSTETLIPFLRRMPLPLVEEYRAQFEALSRTVRESDFLIASTPSIATLARRQGKDAVVHSNLLSRVHVRLSHLIYPLRRFIGREPLIGYMSGSNTHDGDLQSVSGAIAEVLSRNSQASLAICGHSQLPPALKPFSQRILRYPYQDYRVYPWLMGRCRVIIAPIEVINDFANAKSALKVFEAGAVGVPVVASPTDPYAEAIEHGVSGFLASTQEEWTQSLLALLDPSVSARMGAAARAIALGEHSPGAFRDVLARKLMERAGHSSGGAPVLKPMESIGRGWVGTARAALTFVFSPRRLALPALSGGMPILQVLVSESDLSRWIASAPRRGSELLSDGQTLGAIIADRQRPLGRFTSNPDLRPAAEELTPGASFQTTDRDPWFQIESSAWSSGDYRYIFIEMRVRSEAREVWAQIFWKDEGVFSEAQSLRFLVAADGLTHAYVIDLNPEGGGPLFLTGCVQSVRFDPMDAPGEFEVSGFVFLKRAPEDSVPPDQFRARLARRLIKGRGIEIGALHNSLRLPPEVVVRYCDRLTLADARSHYPELNDQALVDPTVICEADHLTPIRSGSEDFVVANHVLEHTKDPIGSLLEWMRVLKPGGRLYVAIPDHLNPHDRFREVTSLEHLRLDHEQRTAQEEPDRCHYHEWALSAYRDIEPQEQSRRAEQLAAQGYSIHFHAYDRRIFERLLAYAGSLGHADVVEFQEQKTGSYSEYIAVVEKRVPAAGSASQHVDIVIPIYNAREFTRRCIESVLAHATGDWRLILVDDASTEEGLVHDLADFAAADPRVVVLRNEENSGFVKTANRGMRLAGGRDVLLLNSDTEVFAGFLDRLAACAHADTETGILSPFSNNATLCSVPLFPQGGPIPEGQTPQSMADLIAACSRRLRPEIVTAVGFCMYVKASVFEKIGYFDEESFGRGFGEENDFCERAKKAGLRIRLADDVFVYHKGKTSFGAEGRALESRNARVLEAKHPGYHAAIALFFEKGSLIPLHDEIRFHLKRRRAGAERAVLFVVHASPFAPAPGGTEFHVRDLVRSLALPRAVIAYPRGAMLEVAEVLEGRVEDPVFYSFQVNRPAERFCMEHPEIEAIVRHWLDLFEIEAVHIHHLMYWPISVGKVFHGAGIPYVYTSHDYYAACPSWNLFDYARAAPCDCRHGAAQESCLAAFCRRLGDSSPIDASTLRTRHREAFQETLSKARAIIWPSEAAGEVGRRYLSVEGVPMRAIEHGYDGVVASVRTPPGERLRVAVMGEVAFPHKGAQRYLDLVGRSRELPIEWHFLGTTRLFGFEEKLKELGLEGRVTFHGRYDRAGIIDHLVGLGIDLYVALPGCHETFCFTLSEVLLAGIPALVSTGTGALCDRVRRDGVGVVVPGVDEALRVLSDFCRDRGRLSALTEKVRNFRHRTMRDNAEDYRALYVERGLLSSGRPPRALVPERLRALADLRQTGARALHPQEDARVAPPWYQKTRWYPRFMLVKPLIPKSLRLWGREFLMRREMTAFRRVDCARLASQGQLSGLKLLRRRFWAAAFESISNDPQFHFTAHPLLSRSVRAIRFRMRCQTDDYAFAQIFWTQEPDEAFGENQSAKIILDAKEGQWREYSFRFDSPEFAEKWHARSRILHLRFDPINMPGRFELGPLEFCG